MKDKVAIITGATSGIGLELVKQLIDLDVKIACCARHTEELQSYFDTIELGKERYLISSFDVQNENSIVAFIEAVKLHFGTIDLLFNNVGINPTKATLTEMTTENLDLLYAINMRAPFIFTREVATVMIANNTKSKIINIHSSACLFSNQSMGAYTGTKGGFDAMTQVFRKELRDHEIKVMNVYPGGVDTNFRKMDRPDYLRPESVAKTIIAQLQLPDEVYLDDVILRPNVERNF
jgi:NADP-dependent 3-hydroxy acid dehydrogenase YdfG